MCTRRSSRGFTLIELMIALTIAAILLAVAVPSYSGSRLNSQLRASANDLVASINLARSEAIKRSATVTMCASSDGDTCGGAWNQGWIVLHDGDVLRRQDAAPTGFLITESSATLVLTFQSTGVDSTPATLTVCRSSPSAGSQERVVTVDATGRSFVSRTTTGSCP